MLNLISCTDVDNCQHLKQKQSTEMLPQNAQVVEQVNSGLRDRGQRYCKEAASTLHN